MSNHSLEPSLESSFCSTLKSCLRNSFGFRRWPASLRCNRAGSRPAPGETGNHVLTPPFQTSLLSDLKSCFQRFHVWEMACFAGLLTGRETARRLLNRKTTFSEPSCRTSSFETRFPVKPETVVRNLGDETGNHLSGTLLSNPLSP